MTPRERAGLAPIREPHPAPEPPRLEPKPACRHCDFWKPRWSANKTWIGSCFENRSPAELTTSTDVCAFYLKRIDR